MARSRLALAAILIAIYLLMDPAPLVRFAYTPSSQASDDSLFAQEQINTCQQRPGACVFAALLCDDELLPALLVLLHSIQKTGTNHPTVVLTLPSVSQGARSKIAALASEVRPVQQLQYPYEGLVKFEQGINKQCRYSKLHLWDLPFERLIYLDVDTVVRKNIDHLFNFDTRFAGVRDLGNVINTGVLVIKPSTDTHREMMELYLTAPSYNRGDQGFLNWFFANHSSMGVSSLPSAYNVPAKLKGFAIGKQLIQDAFIYHYTAETKPWSFHHFYHVDWRINYHPAMFSFWRGLEYDLSMNHSPLRAEYALPRMESELRRGLQAYDWPNLRRREEICQDYDAKYESSGRFPIQDKYSVAISFYNSERLEFLSKLIAHYWLSASVQMVYVTWHAPNVPIPPELEDLASAKKVVILRQNFDSLNNRFNPISGLRTQAVFVCDDDIYIPVDDLDFAFDVWRNRQDSIVGFFPRVHGKKKDGSTFYEMAGVYRRYSIILTKAMFLNANYLHAYTCVLAPEIHRFVDKGMNCEDIAMNMMVSGMTGQAPVCVNTMAIDFGTTKGISISSAFTVRRDQCTADLIDLFGRDTLVMNREMVHPFIKNNFRKIDWLDFDDIMDKERPMGEDVPN
ncbi:exostoses (multiple)-like 2 [Microbotryomycetes sp. JL201]|nr:exostoses (multiple)-like 2 [Microbotryomycetes sp. JL201]